MSAFAMFSLKDPSLLAFDHRRRDPLDNFRSICSVLILEGSQMRDILDPLDPNDTRPGYVMCSVASSAARSSNASPTSAAIHLLSLDG